MEISKMFTKDGYQNVILPESCHFEDDEVFADHLGSAVILIPKRNSLELMMTGLNMFSDDFLQEPVDDLSPQERNGL